MKKLLICSLLSTVLFVQYSIAQTLIQNVTVADVEKRRLLSGYDVLLQGDKIISLAKSGKSNRPPGTEVIDGSGKYLVPGYTDAHVHFFQTGSLFTRPDAIDLRKFRPYANEIVLAHKLMEDFCRRYVSAGITSVIDLGATVNFLSQRDSFINKFYAPAITMAGPLLTTYIPEPFKNLGNDDPFVLMTTEDSVRKSVREQIEAGADMIKVWYIVLEANIERGAMKNFALVKAAADEAHRNNKKLAVHATQRITAKLAVEAGADFLVHNVDDEIVHPDFIALLKKNGTILCPTIVVNSGYGRAFTKRYKFSAAELKLANPESIATILNYPFPDTVLQKNYMRSLLSARALAKEKHTDSVLHANLRLLHNGGVIIAAGTDAGNIGTQHAGSFMPELQAMKDAGLTLWDLLEAATVNGAKAAGKEKISGSVTPGKIASLNLLRSNPLEKLENFADIELVFNRGIKIDPATLVKSGPEALAQQQLNAYNAHDLEAFLAPYSDSVEVYTIPGNVPLLKGKEAMRKQFEILNTIPSLYCKLLNRISEGNTVIDHEEIYSDGISKPFRGTAIFIIEKNKIAKVYFPKR